MEESNVSTSQLASIWKAQEARFQELELKIQGKVKQDYLEKVNYRIFLYSVRNNQVKPVLKSYVLLISYTSVSIQSLLVVVC